MATRIHQRFRPPSETTVEAETLLMRYPNLSEGELATLINLFPYIRILDLGMMTSDDRLAGKLDAFHHDHGKRLGTPSSSLIVFLALSAALVFASLLWWALAPTLNV